MMDIAIVLTLALAVLTGSTGCAGAAVVPETAPAVNGTTPASATTLAAATTIATPAATTAALPAVPAEPLLADKKAPAPDTPVVVDAPDKKMAPMVVPPGNSSISMQARPPLLDPCSEDAVCVAKYGQHAACREYWCACVDGADYDSGFSKRCLLSRLGLGVGCKENGDCKTPNTYCKANRCHCAAGFVFSDDASRCLPVATQADPSCAEARQCVILLNSGPSPAGAAVCLDGKCRCRYDHEFSNGTCVLKKARGMACSSDVECEDLAGGACLQGVCGCKDGAVPAVAANKCLPVLRSLGAPCEEHIQCSEGLGDLAVCRAGACACEDGAHLADTNKCACEAGRTEDNKRCERPMLAQAGAAPRQQQPGGGGASGLQSSLLLWVFASVPLLALRWSL